MTHRSLWEAFTSFQGKDYLHSIEKLNHMEQLFPDSPLRDVSLLMLARSQYRSGDNDAAARRSPSSAKNLAMAPLPTPLRQTLPPWPNAARVVKNWLPINNCVQLLKRYVTSIWLWSVQLP